MKKWIVFVLIAGLLWLGPAAAASGGDPIDAGELVVSATLTDDTAATATGTIIVITREEMENSGAATLAELLAQYPGLWANLYGQEVGGLSVAMIRGTAAGQALVMINGVPINSSTNGTPNLNEIMLEDVERIEVMLGPASHLYGANALGGVINIVTRKPKDGFSYSLSAGGGGIGSVHAAWGRTGKKAGINLSMGQRHASGGRDNSDADDAALRAALTWNPIEAVQVKLNLGYQTAEYGLPGPVPAEGAIPEFGSAQSTSVVDRERDGVLSAALQVEWATGRDGFARLSLTGESRDVDYTTVYRVSGNRVDEVYLYDTERIGATLVWQTEALSNHRLTLGADGRWDALSAVTRSTPEGGAMHEIPWGAQAWIAGVWANDAWSLTDWLQITGGARLDWSAFGINVSPYAGILLDLGRHTVVRASAGKAYRVPTFNDLYWPMGGNPDLQPESGWSVEGRLETAQERWFAGSGVFAWQTRNLIAWQNWSPQNIDRATAIGIEGKAGLTLAEGLTLTAHATWLHGRQFNSEVRIDPDTGDPETRVVERTLRVVPEFSGGCELKWTTAEPGWQVTLSGSYVGRRLNYYTDYSSSPDMATKVMPPAFLLDLQVRRALSDWGWLTIGAYNLTNSRYDVQFGNTIDDLNYPGQGFRMAVGLSMEF